MSERVLTSGNTEAEMPDFYEIKPNGQQKAYVVLSDYERANGFMNPVRYSYVHDKCETSTKMSRAIAETYAKDPKFYGSTFCCGCRAHFPVSEFKWEGTDLRVGE